MSPPAPPVVPDTYYQSQAFELILAVLRHGVSGDPKKEELEKLAEAAAIIVSLIAERASKKPWQAAQ